MLRGSRKCLLWALSKGYIMEIAYPLLAVAFCEIIYLLYRVRNLTKALSEMLDVLKRMAEAGRSLNDRVCALEEAGHEN